MLRVKRWGLVVGLAVLGLAPVTAAQAAAQPSQQDVQYLQAIHQANLTEIAAGNLAQQNASNQQVKDLGARFVTDHTQLDESVQNIASQLNVTLPNQPNSNQQAVLNQLETLNGEEFDTRWVAASLAAHQQAIAATETELAQGSDPTVQQLAQDAEPVLQAHYEALVELAQALGVPVPSGTGTGTASPGLSGTPTPGATTGAPGTGSTQAPGGGQVTESPAVTETPAPANS